jgi:hypothetical protein
MRRAIVIALGLLALLLVCLLLGLLAVWLYGALRSRAVNDRPLVLIHAPLNREQVQLGQGILVHATTRAESGVARVELWGDGAFVTARENPADAATSPLVLTAGWEPTALGLHTLLVRAISATGVKGQATVAIEVVEAVDPGTVLGGHVVQAGETLQSIADEHGVTTDDLSAVNPDLSPEGPAPGDVVLYPEMEPAPGGVDEPPGVGPTPPGAEPPAAGDPPPVPHGAAPGSPVDVLGLLFPVERYIPLVPAGGEPQGLRVELLALQTAGDYESVHCYVGLGELDPRWYPDEDYDQRTDESFASLGGGAWDIASHLGDDAAPTILWPVNEPLPIEVTCVGMIGGGDDSERLGRVELAPGPELWDSVTRRSEVSVGGEGAFWLDYRLTRLELIPIGPQAWTDETMTPPTNVSLGFYTLDWDYAPEPDEEEIDGFRIYLNETLLWIEPPEARQTLIPPEWYRPPCGERYSFTVTAFRHGHPDGPESPHSNAAETYTGDPPCERTVVVTFETLTTRDLGGDQGRSDSVGPVYGGFYANDQEVAFDSRCGWWPGESCWALRFSHNSQMDVAWLASHWGDGPPRVVVDVPEGENLVVGYHIEDEDSWPNEDDDLCQGETEVPSERLGLVNEGVIPGSWRCSVTFTTRRGLGSPIGEPGMLLPLPQLEVEDMTVDRSSGRLQIHVRNTGDATWPSRDLTVRVQRGSGDLIGVYEWPEFVLFPGDVEILEHPDLAPEHPLDSCVILDPGNEVPEYDDEFRDSYPWCPPRPDLTIGDVGYDAQGETLLVTVLNRSDVPLERRDLNLKIDFPAGSPFAGPSEEWSDMSIDPLHTYVAEWPMAGREYMLDGYTVTVDPDDHIAESDETNNSYDVPGSTRLHLRWSSIWMTEWRVPGRVPFAGDIEYYFNSWIETGGWSRPVSYWWIGPDHPCVVSPRNGEFGVMIAICGQPHYTDFDIAGDETLVVNVNGEVEGPFLDRPVYFLGNGVAHFDSEEWATVEACPGPGIEYEPSHWISVYPTDVIGGWTTYFWICRIEE